MTNLSHPLPLRRGAPMKNRFMLAPLTNQQSHADGTLSDAEFHWLTKRSEGGFALTMTCAAHVQKGGARQGRGPDIRDLAEKGRTRTGPTAGR